MKIREKSFATRLRYSQEDQRTIKIPHARTAGRRGVADAASTRGSTASAPSLSTITTSGGAPQGAGDEALGTWLDARRRSHAEREAVLASDADRERVCSLLSAAFGEGRLTSAELDERTTRALASRTHGQLEDVLDGLAGPGAGTLWASRPEGGIVPRIVFWVVGLFTSPFVLIGTLLLLFGDDLGSRIFGLVFLVVFLPGLIALYRWAHPRS
ncbi:DUF1707 SHOCT-like domain-containing protein [Nocardioides exalbidus]|uniref:DUF1707 SHOCT-like domain-containing protein n=1 Tax=Nocardioides exalbidus TaxID=402596 RepID=UPI000A4C0113|nr:DUF1707 domain-containing protein [Nocardioides exalbidus]